jgi:hypothetical protein
MPWWAGNGDGVLLGVGAVLVWALALYVGSRASSRRAPLLAAAAMICLAAYLAGEALANLAPDNASWSTWVRRAFWAPGLAAPIWVCLTLVLAADEGPAYVAEPARRLLVPVAVVLLVLGVGFSVVGIATRLIQDWSAPEPHHHPPGPAFPLYQAFLVGCLLVAAFNLVMLWRLSPPGSPLRARFAWLCASALLFLVGGGWVVIGSGIYGQPGLPGQALLIAGMAIMGWNLARYGALLAGEAVLGDFLQFAATMLGIVGLYGVILLTLAPDYGWLERGVPLLLLVMATHVLVDTRGHLLDRVLLMPLVSTLRGQLRELANRVVRQPDELAALADVRETVDRILREREQDVRPADEPADLRVLVEGALRHLNDLPSLSEHPLLLQAPRVGAASTPLERAASLRAELDQAIERLRPPGARPSPGTAALGGWLHYLVLKEAYVEGRLNKQIMQRYALSEGTFHRARRRAIDALTADLGARWRADALVSSTEQVGS